jgi:hypothetical protein
MPVRSSQLPAFTELQEGDRFLGLDASDLTTKTGTLALLRTWLQGQIAGASVYPVRPVSAKTSGYTLVAADAVGTWFRMNPTVSASLTVPPNSSVALPIGWWCEVVRIGAGTVTIQGGTGVTVNKPADRTYDLRVQRSAAGLVKVGTNEWDLAGDLGEAP